MIFEIGFVKHHFKIMIHSIQLLGIKYLKGDQNYYLSSEF